jgi:hypothetical protein
MPRALSLTTPMMGTTVGARADVALRCTGFLDRGKDLVYAATVPAGQRLTATATPAADAGLDVVVNLVAGPAASCRAVPPVCLAKADRGLRGEPDTASFVNASAMSQPVLIVVGSYSPSPGDADFTLSTVTVPPPPGDSCTTATPLTSGTTLAAQTLTDYGDDVDDGDRCASAGFVGTAADRFYSVALPTGKQLTVTVTPQPGLDMLLSFIDAAVGCGAPLTCLAGDVTAMALAGQSDTLVYTNRSGAPLNILVDVDSRAGSTGTFDVVATIADPPPGDFCGIATTLRLGTPTTGSTLGATNDYEGGERCASGVTGPDVAYALSVPAGQRATVTVTPTSGDGGFNPSISLVPGPAASCEASPRGCAEGTCRLRVAPGDVCDATTTSLTGSHCVAGRCSRQPRVGERCSGTCNGSLCVTGACLAGASAPCVGALDACGSRSACVAGTCTDAPAPSDACDAAARQPCEGGGTCVEGRCQPAGCVLGDGKATNDFSGSADASVTSEPCLPTGPPEAVIPLTAEQAQCVFSNSPSPSCLGCHTVSGCAELRRSNGPREALWNRRRALKRTSHQARRP